MKQYPPKSARFLLCDDARTEANGKVMIIGLYLADRILILKSSPTLPKGAKALVNQVTVLCSLTDGLGKYPGHAILSNPIGKTVIEGSLGEMTFTKDTPAIVVIQRPQFVVTDYGEYVLKITVGKTEFIYKFEIVEALASVGKPSDIALPKVSKSKNAKKVKAS